MCRSCWRRCIPRFISVGSPWIELLAGDMTVVQCLLLAAGVESCIRCGLIQSNTGDILKAENAQKARKLKLEEQTKLYDLVEQESAPHFARLEALLSALSNAQSQEEAKPLLGRIAVIMTYIKRSFSRHKRISSTQTSCFYVSTNQRRRSSFARFFAPCG